MYNNILSAQERLHGIAHQTPVVTSRTLNEMAGAEVYLKCENLQRIGAFKFRGAYNAISRLSAEQKAAGVITYSSGNHAQGIALASKLQNVSATIVMPTNAPSTKLAATKGYGATVVQYDPEKADRKVLAETIAAEHGYTIIPPYDHNDIIAGQATSALELHQEVEDLNQLLVPCGGGGLLAGSAVATKGIRPNCQVIGIEPELADDATRSFHTKELVTIYNPPTIADGTRTPSLGELTFPLVLEHVDDMRTVSEQAIIDAVKFLFYRTKMVVEPSGALGVAALMSGSVKANGKVGVILSGGNVDAPTMTKILGE